MTLEMIDSVNAVLAVQEAAWLPSRHDGHWIPTAQRDPSGHGVTFFGENDQWMFLRSDHPNMCDTCAGYHLTQYFGGELRSEFPNLIVVDENSVYPQVHPNCFCLLTRVFPVKDVELPPIPDKLRDEGVTDADVKSVIELPEDYYDDELPWELIALGVIFKPKPKLKKLETEKESP